MSLFSSFDRKCIDVSSVLTFIYPIRAKCSGQMRIVVISYRVNLINNLTN